jgi:hypothetical protein
VSPTATLDDAREVIDLGVVVAELRVRLAVSVGHAAGGQLRFGGVAGSEPAGPVGQERHQLVGKVVDVVVAHV